MAAVVQEAEWVFAKSLEKLRKQKGGTWTRWSPSGIIYKIMAGRPSFTWPKMECMALAVFSLCKLLRLGEAWRAARSGLGQLVFSGEKRSMPEWHCLHWINFWFNAFTECLCLHGMEAA